ncbi:3-hydroxybutyryl-CoA dehydrogenase [Paraburkholderia silvatlantica]|uniref:3-hydroxybutyryl-CoA dehydrogenase n=1 Tax=Paraburkholderia silvatlantica TaxID=321895 RepID=UPI00105CA936|nr:3-hydroxybutyryl-CoA dehydrogenase [Paraburkholderia silvatlantica]TDQ98529.1 3-hydroxyacyl-CoA dehydrogenase [Paraburkholderia silvatlantica]
MSRADEVAQIHVLGAGRMGQGIALAFAFAGLQVVLIDFKARPDAARVAFSQGARSAIDGQLRALVALGRLSPDQAACVLERIAIVDREAGADALRDCDLMFEAVPEQIDAKIEALAWAEARLNASAVIASTTSSFLVTDLQARVTRPGRLLNAHWLNPAHLIPLVEVSASQATDADAVDLTTALLKRIGKRPILCAPSAGYIVPRIQALAMNEAARLVEEGVASAEAIDDAIRTGFGLRFAVLGLLEFIDWGGCDILYYASHYLAREIAPRFEPADIVTRNMKHARDGLRTGSGFYDYAAVDVPAYVAGRLGAFGSLLDHLGLAPVYDGARKAVRE